MTAYSQELLKKSCEDDTKFAFDQYVSIYHACFKPAASSSSRRHYTKECTERLDRWTTARLRAGASNERPDDMLEYGLRLATGTRAQFNETTALTLFLKVMQDPVHPENARAIAANLTCTLLKRDIRVDAKDEFDGARAFCLADLSAMYGLFAWCSLDLIQIYKRRGHPPGWKAESFTHLWKAYDAYQAEIASGRVRPPFCAVCATLPSATVRLRNRACQKEDWPEHRKWCISDGGEEPTMDSDHDDLY
ncbi:unnamed protein product [Cyclocybe aegerita]|uniref:MYND-type domain-containing protein n=1 Tax=Cyclocybe aegerita TaxID=1973307 RepID=A0A8S0VUH4_CYCAE|nr:unnamed protein product [Cyclocybe aegerita]